jgi:hypothetical protein
MTRNHPCKSDHELRPPTLSQVKKKTPRGQVRGVSLDNRARGKTVIRARLPLAA